MTTTSTLGSASTPIRSNKRTSSCIDIDSDAATNSSSSSSSRNGASSALDCQSLQSSLKRVRLSCSPGELRLEKDLQCLPALGWQLSSSSYIPPTQQQPQSQLQQQPQYSKSSSHLNAWDSNPRWRKGSAELQILDPLRLKLTIQKTKTLQHFFETSPDVENGSGSSSSSSIHNNYSNNSPSTGISIDGIDTSTQCCIWIQIPRMYPHKPPLIVRTENADAIQICDAPRTPLEPSKDEQLQLQSQAQAQAQAQALHHSLGVTHNQVRGLSSKVMEWSPICQIGDLLSFLLEHCCHQHPYHHRRQQQQFTDTALSSTSMTPQAISPLTTPNPSIPTKTTTNHYAANEAHPVSTNSHYDSFTEEHKIEDCTNSNGRYYNNTMGVENDNYYNSINSSRSSSELEIEIETNNETENDEKQSRADMARISGVFAPNRFDKGYGKYQNPMYRDIHDMEI